MHYRGEQRPEKLLICEGMHDLEFFDAFRKARQIPDLSLVTAEKNVEPARGITAFNDLLIAAATERFFRSIRIVVLIADNDDRPLERFKDAQKQIELANAAREENDDQGRFGVPAVPVRSKQSTGQLPSMRILMLPKTNEPGCLETLLRQSLEKRCGRRRREALSQYCVRTQVNSWPVQKLAKLKTRILLSTMNKKNPYMSLGHAWKKDHDKFIPLDHPSLNALETRLRNL